MDVYDLLHPSPPSLEHFACTTVAIDLCLREIKRHLQSDGSIRLNVHDLQKKTFLECLTSKIPPVIISMIQQYANRLSTDIRKWFSHHEALLPPKFGIYNYFTDLCCDLEGRINYAKTGERLLLCDQVSDKAKFKMACWYCLENDILQLWPKVSQSFSENEFTLSHNPELYYWMKRLNNRLGEIVLDEETSSVEEVIHKALYDDFFFWKWPSVKYFLNRADQNAHIRLMVKMFENPHLDHDFDKDRKKIFYRYFLLRLDEETLRHLVATRGDELVVYALPAYRTFVWEYIKDKMTADVFCRLVLYIFTVQAEGSLDWCEIWPSAPSHLKRSAIPSVLQHSHLFKFWCDNQSIPLFNNYYRQSYNSTNHKVVFVLMMVLSDAPMECRRTFWIENWRFLMRNHINIRNISIDDLCNLVNLCFGGDQSQITQFKKDAISSCDYLEIHAWGYWILMLEGRFDELEKFLAFWHENDEEAIRDTRLKLLSKNRKDILQIRNHGLLNEFIDKAYSEVELASKFKNSLLESLEEDLRNGTFCWYFLQIMDFIDIFRPSQAMAMRIKKQMVPEIVEYLQTARACLTFVLARWDSDYRFSDSFETFMNWLLETDVEITRFKERLDVDGIVLDLIEFETESNDFLDDSSYCLDNWLANCYGESQCVELPLKILLKWYFVTPESLNEFLNKYADNQFFVKLML